MSPTKPADTSPSRKGPLGLKRQVVGVFGFVRQQDQRHDDIGRCAGGAYRRGVVPLSRCNAVSRCRAATPALARWVTPARSTASDRPPVEPAVRTSLSNSSTVAASIRPSIRSRGAGAKAMLTFRSCAPKIRMRVGTLPGDSRARVQSCSFLLRDRGARCQLDARQWDPAEPVIRGRDDRHIPDRRMFKAALRRLRPARSISRRGRSRRPSGRGWTSNRRTRGARTSRHRAR